MKSSPVLLAALVAFAPPLAGCQPYRIEYHKRPAYYKRMVKGDLPDRVVADDGTIILYETIGQEGSAPDPFAEDGTERKLFRIREETEDGEIVLRAVLPQHVVANTLNCIRLNEYDLLWDQLVAEETKLAYAAEGYGKDEFKAFFKRNEADLAKMLNRMLMGFSNYETVVEARGGRIECRFWPQIAKVFRYKKVVIVRENWSMKLLMIH